MGFLDNPATIQPPVEDQDRVDAAWTGCELMYRTGRQPSIVRHWQTAARMDETIDEVREQPRSEPASDVTTELAMRLAQTRQVIVFEIDDDDVPEDVWEMLDASEGYIAGKLDGIVVVRRHVN